MKTFADKIVIWAVLGGTAGLVIVRALIAWTAFRLQRRITDLTRDGARRLQRLDDLTTPKS